MTTPPERTFLINVDPRHIDYDGKPIEVSKAIDETLDYAFDWTNRLDEDEIVEASEWILPDEDLVIAEGAQPFEGKTSAVWLSGGKEDRVYRVVNRVTTDDDRILEQTLIIKTVVR